jgi:hypothetical protein
MKVEMMDHDSESLSRDDFPVMPVGQAALPIGGLTDLKPKLEWVAATVALKAGERTVARLQLALSMAPARPAADSESPAPPLHRRVAPEREGDDVLLGRAGGGRQRESLPGARPGRRRRASAGRAQGRSPAGQLPQGPAGPGPLRKGRPVRPAQRRRQPGQRQGTSWPRTAPMTTTVAGAGLRLAAAAVAI